MSKRKADEPPRDLDPRVLKAITELREGYEIGSFVLKTYGEHAEPGVIKQVAKIKGVNPDSIRKMRQFALEYSEEELDELCKLCRDNDRVLGVSFIYRLVSVKDKKKREALQRSAIVEHWSIQRLNREMRAKCKLGHIRRRTRAMPATVKEALAQFKEIKGRFVALLEHCLKLAKVERDAPEAKDLRRQAKELLAALGAGTETGGSRDKSRK